MYICTYVGRKVLGLSPQLLEPLLDRTNLGSSLKYPGSSKFSVAWSTLVACSTQVGYSGSIPEV